MDAILYPWETDGSSNGLAVMRDERNAALEDYRRCGDGSATTARLRDMTSEIACSLPRSR